MKHHLSELVDLAAVDHLMQSLHQATGVPYALLDDQSNILVAVGWQDICTKFHRVNPVTCNRCNQSDQYIRDHLHDGPYVGYRCRQGLMDYATPLVIEGEHLASVFTGQVLNEPPDMDFFEKQADTFHFDKPSYMEALKKVPIVSTARVEAVMAFLVDLAHMLATNGLDRLRKLEAEQGLLAANVAHQLSQRKSEFIAVLAHELRNPLAPIKSCVAVLSDPSVGEPSKTSALQIIERQAGAIERLLEDLLDISRIEQGKLSYQPVRSDLCKVIEQAVETANPHFKAKRQNILVDPTPEPCFVNVDERRMVQVISNLLNNASKFSTRQGTISVSILQQQEQALISVKDTGIGIPAENLKAIFETFFQMPNAAGPTNSGLGLGLSLAGTLVKMHGGTIEAKSEGLGKGSEFIVRLPLANKPETQPASIKEEESLDSL